MALVTYQEQDAYSLITLDDGKANALSFAMAAGRASSALVLISVLWGKWMLTVSVYCAGAPILPADWR
jgi:hypothetical protein